MGRAEVNEYNVKAVNTSANRRLYKKRVPIYPKLVSGKYRLVKWVLLFVTLGIYYGLPWIRWERGPAEPSQAVLVDFSGQRFYFFFIEIWPDELYYVTGLLILSALLLFLVTSLFGRLWCGYACPQTVWTDLFIAVERMVEGDRNKRLRLAKQPWGAGKVIKKTIKHGLWLLISAATGGAWVLYFHDAPTVVGNMFAGTAPMSAYLFFGLLTFTTYSLAGLMREQVCTYMCPWPRIQAAMTDEDTFNVGYFAARGEPRGKHKKGKDNSHLGDCVDCKACVVACPMGIDIREGDQLECINCGLCADACDDIMKKLAMPTGLIAYSSDYRQPDVKKSKRFFPVLFRGRTLFYSVAILIVSAIMTMGLTSRATVEFGIERNRAPAFTTLSDGSVRNAMMLRILNKESAPVEYLVRVSGPKELILAAVGHDISDLSMKITVPGDRMQKTRVFMTLPANVKNKPGQKITVELVAPDEETVITKVINFIGE